MEVVLKNEKTIFLSPIKKPTDNFMGKKFELIDNIGKIWMTVELIDNTFEIKDQDENIHDDDIASKLEHLVLKIIESEQTGIDISESEVNGEENPFNPEDIKVHAKQFSLRLITDMIDEGDLDLSPDFQRNFVWDNYQKSRLIESILLRIPLPMFYFSEDNQGRITVVDGQQRLTTIKDFMDNKFALTHLEYLSASCGGRYYSNSGNKKGLEPKYSRWFKQTQFSVNVIDPSSPSKVKFDIFRRINTGGKALNNQEIRNCIANKTLRTVLGKMVESDEFKKATDYSVTSKRMLDQELALRFLLFSRLKEKDGNIEGYNGYMDPSLDELTEELGKYKEHELENYILAFSKAMINADYLLGSKYAFRKIRLYDIGPNVKKQLINKALFVVLSVLLSDYEPDIIKTYNNKNSLLEPLATLINDDEYLLKSLTYGTNGWNKIVYVYGAISDLIIKNIRYDQFKN